MSETLSAGVVGVGSMGRNHARVYSELPNAELVGVADLDAEAARTVARDYGTVAREAGDLLSRADLVSVAVPTAAHPSMLERCLDAGTHALVEKPYVEDLPRGRELAERARAEDLVLQVGHIERFNPAVRALADIVPNVEVLALDAQRLGPPREREVADSAVFDLMIHDIDVVCSLLGKAPVAVDAAGAAGNRYATATCRFDDGVVADLTASRVTQRKVRKLGITARECRVRVDYMNQSVEIHRHTAPAYIENDGAVRERVESVVERPIVENGEPLKAELESFVAAARDGAEPVVTAEDGLRAVEVARTIDDIAAGRERPGAETEVPT
ncbi:Gfo/Idh/MocA family oxidoreductase [Halorarum halobium]|uniref:Gfo/Idh/MocA family oxidoreductase n=1 Tax=Halorarum halobium TaxID=3075121 RepID=UPI0028AAC0BC|nr:Gfo/Idh/MocA family oxidoreductase [Halobaculum sp. XH14]